MQRTNKKMTESVTAVILAGGRAVRMGGEDKGLVLLRDRPIGKPLAVIAKTVKGKGVTKFENDNAWHHAVLTKAQYELALDDLKNYS